MAACHFFFYLPDLVDIQSQRLHGVITIDCIQFDWLYRYSISGRLWQRCRCAKRPLESARFNPTTFRHFNALGHFHIQMRRVRRCQIYRNKTLRPIPCLNSKLFRPSSAYWNRAKRIRPSDWGPHRSPPEPTGAHRRHPALITRIIATPATLGSLTRCDPFQEDDTSCSSSRRQMEATGSWPTLEPLKHHTATAP